MNAIYFGNILEFIFEFIPQIIFMLALFGYMIVMIFIKWSIDWTGRSDHAPSLITQLMNIVLKLGDIVRIRKDNVDEPLPLWGDGTSQILVNRIILILAFLCIPILLLPKPIITYMDKKNKKIMVELSQQQDRNYDLIIEDVIYYLYRRIMLLIMKNIKLDMRMNLEKYLFIKQLKLLNLFLDRFLILLLIYVFGHFRLLMHNFQMYFSKKLYYPLFKDLDG